MSRRNFGGIRLNTLRFLHAGSVAFDQSLGSSQVEQFRKPGVEQNVNGGNGPLVANAHDRADGARQRDHAKPSECPSLRGHAFPSGAPTSGTATTGTGNGPGGVGGVAVDDTVTVDEFGWLVSAAR